MSKLIIYLDLLGPLLALPFYLSGYKRKGGGHLLLLFFLLIQLLANGWAKILWQMHTKNNIFVYQLNALFSCIVVTIYIFLELKKICSPKFTFMLAAYAVSSIIILLIMILLEDTSFFNGLSYTFTGFTICVFCVIFYLRSLANLDEENLIKTCRFWAVSAFIIYYSISFFIFMYYKIFTKLSMENFQVLWGIHNFVLFLSCFLLIIASKHR
ncbi:MAG: hypothetical protein ABI760_11455 [Ferruginibacter sp.]